MTISLRSALATFIFALCLFGAATVPASAQTCRTKADCAEPKICFVRLGSSQGTCQNPPTDTSDPTTPSPSPSPSDGGAGTTCGGALCNPLKVDTLQGLLGLIIDAAIYIGTIVLVLALVYVGFLFVVSRGNEERIRDARRYFFWIVIGGLLVLGARGLSEVIRSTATSLGGS